jgi:hypothetical protein
VLLFFSAEQLPADPRSGMTDDVAGGEPANASASAGPGGLREGIRGYLRAMHEAYLAAGGGTGGVGGHTLATAPFTVVVVAAHSLHLIATRDAVAAPAGTADADADAVGALEWRIVFFDPSVLAALDAVPAGPDEIPAVRDAVGASSTLYHFVAGPGAALTPHHATHTGTGLAYREQADR